MSNNIFFDIRIIIGLELKSEEQGDINSVNNINSIIPSKESIEFFEFVSINGFDAGYQHIYAMPVPDGIMVPEFININTLPDRTPDINIELV